MLTSSSNRPVQQRARRRRALQGKMRHPQACSEFAGEGILKDTESGIHFVEAD